MQIYTSETMQSFKGFKDLEQRVVHLESENRFYRSLAQFFGTVLVTWTILIIGLLIFTI